MVVLLLVCMLVGVVVGDYCGLHLVSWVVGTEAHLLVFIHNVISAAVYVVSVCVCKGICYFP